MAAPWSGSVVRYLRPSPSFSATTMSTLSVIVDFNVLVGTVFDLADDLYLPLGPAEQAADAGDSVIGVVGMRDDAGDSGCHYWTSLCSQVTRYVGNASNSVVGAPVVAPRSLGLLRLTGGLGLDLLGQALAVLGGEFDRGGQLGALQSGLGV